MRSSGSNPELFDGVSATASCDRPRAVRTSSALLSRAWLATAELTTLSSAAAVAQRETSVKSNQIVVFHRVNVVRSANLPAPCTVTMEQRAVRALKDVTRAADVTYCRLGTAALRCRPWTDTCSLALDWPGLLRRSSAAHPIALSQRARRASSCISSTRRAAPIDDALRVRVLVLVLRIIHIYLYEYSYQRSATRPNTCTTELLLVVYYEYS